MAKITIYESMQEGRGKGEKKFVVLIDPDKVRLRDLERLLALATEARVDYFFVGGSLVVNSMLNQVLEYIRTHCTIPTILFPGSHFQINERADAILFLSLISGRNPDLLIGQHVIAAPYLRESGLEVLPTGYLLIDGGQGTTVSYISNTTPIPHDKSDIAVCTAVAGEMLGLKLIFLDAGSGALQPVSPSMIEAVSEAVSLPLVVGGGIRTPEKASIRMKDSAESRPYHCPAAD